ncbi:unnamed protein product, partial [Polarella glacialis]
MGACKDDSPARVLTLLQELRDRDLQPSEITYTAALQGCEGTRNWLRAFELLVEMRRDSLVPNRITLTAAISTCKEARVWWRAVRLLAILQQSGSEPNMIAYNAVISACERCGQWAEALRCLVSSQGMGLTPDVVTFNAASSACEKGRQWEWALHFLESMRFRGVKVDVISFSAAISACEKSFQWERALLLLLNMHCEQVAPNMITINSAISACSRGIKWELALQLLWGVQTDGLSLLRPDATTYSATMNACGHGLQWERAVRLLAVAQVDGRQQLDAAIFNTAIGACERASRWGRVICFLDDMRHHRLAASTLSFNAALDAFARSGEWSQALRAMHDMKGLRLQPDVVTYSASLAISSSPDQGRSWAGPNVRRLLSEMKQQSVEANSVTYQAALAACENSADKQNVPELVELLSSSSLTLARQPLPTSSSTVGGYQIGVSAMVAALDLLDTHGLLKSLVATAFRCWAYKASLLQLLHLQCHSASDSEQLQRRPLLEALPGLGCFDAQALADLGLEGAAGLAELQARLVSRRGFGSVRPATKPTAKGLAAWLAMSCALAKWGSAHRAESQGRPVGYSGGSGRKEGPLRPVLAEHDRSGHAERQALLDALTTLR